MHNYFQL